MSLAQFWGDRQGNMAVIFAAGFTVSSALGAVAIDAAMLYHERRTIQNAVDLAALAAATDPARAATLAQESLVESGLLAGSATTGLMVVAGNYTANAALTPEARFVTGATPLNAVKVRFEQQGELHFAQGWGAVPTLSAQATATVRPIVSFSIGSRLASLQGGIANVVLNGLLGTTVGLSAMDYNALLNVDVDAFSFLNAMAGQLNLTAGTYDDLLALSVDHGKLAAALANLVTGVEQRVLLDLATRGGNNGKVQVGKLLNLGDLGKLAIGSTTGRGLFSKISALELLAVSAGLSDGNKQVSLALTAAVPGLVGIDASLAVGEPPQGGGWFAVGPTGTLVRTAQTRLRLVSNLTLNILLLPLVDVRLPLYLDMANGEAIVASANCPTHGQASGSAVIAARPGVAQLILGEVNANTFGAFNTAPNVGVATLINALGIKVTGAARAEIAQPQPTALSFSPTEIAAGTVKTAKTTSFTGSLVGSLLGDLRLTAAGISLGVIGPLLQALLTPLTPVLDLTINRLLESVGLSLGEVDVRVYGVRCTHPVLVG